MKAFKLLSLSCLFLFVSLYSSGQNRGIENSEKYDRLIIRNAMLIDGNGTPMKGPYDVIIEKNLISSIKTTSSSDNAYKDEEHVIDASGMYLLPGFINNHVHVHKRGDCPLEYLYKLWLACGITSVRDVGSVPMTTLEERTKSNSGEIAAPRIFTYMVVRGNDPLAAREQVRNYKKIGADGIKIFGLERDVMEAVLDESKALGMKVAHHVGVEETDARDDYTMGTATIEHWYGIPDAALKGSQNFPAYYNYNNENDRFRWAGSLWKEADPERLQKVLENMVTNNVAWIPTFAIYEANRDLIRAQNQPWFKEYLHPTLAGYFSPSPSNHGSYHWNWTTRDEINWKENYGIWMKAVQDFYQMGGKVGAGEDAGFIYMMYGFTFIRELELLQEAGFHPVDVIMSATGTNAEILGLENELGRIREGYKADLILVEGNPLENLKYLYPTGITVVENNNAVTKGGVKWTIKDGIVYNNSILLKDLRQMVESAKNR